MCASLQSLQQSAGLAESSLIGVWFVVAKLSRASWYKSILMKKPIYAALDLHSRHRVLGSMDHDGQTQPRKPFGLRRRRRPLYRDCEAARGAAHYLRTTAQPAHQLQSHQERRSGRGRDVFASAPRPSLDSKKMGTKCPSRRFCVRRSSVVRGHRFRTCFVADFHVGKASLTQRRSGNLYLFSASDALSC